MITWLGQVPDRGAEGKWHRAALVGSPAALVLQAGSLWVAPTYSQCDLEITFPLAKEAPASISRKWALVPAAPPTSIF